MSEEQNLIFKSRPELRRPLVLCGLDGWVNSGNVSTGGVDYLIEQLQAELFAEMPASPYHIYQVSSAQMTGPVFRMQDGLIVDSRLPRNRFYFVRNESADHDLILFKGFEPNLRWEEYAANVVSLVKAMGAVRLYTCGGLLDKIPYTREPYMTCTCTGESVRDEMKEYNVLFSSREGPATFNQMLLYACREKGLEGVGFTVRIPYYPEYNLALGDSRKSIKAVLVRLNHLLHLNLSFEELDDDIKEIQDKLDLIRQQNEQFNTYIEQLEKDYVEMTYQETLDISSREAIEFAEQFLKENQDRPKE